MLYVQYNSKTSSDAKCNDSKLEMIIYPVAKKQVYAAMSNVSDHITFENQNLNCSFSRCEDISWGVKF